MFSSSHFIDAIIAIVSIKSMSLLLRHLKLNNTHSILICPIHECVVLPNSVKNHFDKNHGKDLLPIERTQLQQEADELSESVSLKRDYSQFQFAEDDGSPLHEIPYLRLHSSFICNLCEHICSKKSAGKTMKEHLRKHHNISAGSVPQGTLIPSQYVRATFSQRYFIGATKEAEGLNILRYFEVIPLDPSTCTVASCTDRDEIEHAPSTDHTLSTTHTAETQDLHKAGLQGTTVLHRLQEQLDKATTWARGERKDRLATIPHGQSVQTNPWLAYTRFLEVLPDNWEAVLAYMAIPTREHEPALYHLHCTTKSMVRTWQNSTAKTSRYARIRVMQEDMNDVPLLPLETYQNFNLQHALPLQKIFVFFYRVLVQGLPKPDQLLLSNTQQDAWSQVVEHLDNLAGEFPAVEVGHTRTRLELLEQLCYSFWLSLVEQTCLDDEFELAFVVPIAYMIVSSQSKSVREVYNFATDITALKKMVRLASIQKFREQFVDPARDTNFDNIDYAITHLEASSLINEQVSTTQSREETNRSVANQFKIWVYDYLTTEYPTPMNWLINTARYLSRFRYGENLDAFVHWNRDTVTVRGIRTSLSKYTSMVHNEYEEASAMLCKLTFVESRSMLPAIPWDMLVEDPSNRAPGFSIFSSETSALSKQAYFIQEQLIIAYKQGSEVLLSDLQSARQLYRYSGLVQEFLNTLLGLVHYTSGQPARGTELLSIHHENPTNGMLRNVFLYDGLVALVPQYHKGYNRDKSLKVIYRFLPRSIGSLLVWYLWLVRPFYALIQHQAPESIQKVHVPRATSTLLWPDQDGAQYATSKLLRQVVERATERWMGQSINLSTLRHLLIAFGRKIDSIHRIPGELSKEDVDEIVDAVEAEEREMQAGHSANTASAVYALDISQVFNKKFDRARGQFKVSVKWHGALGFDIEEAFDSLYPPVKPPTSSDDIADRIQCNYKRLLQENFGKDAGFRPQQEKVIQAVMGGETVVAYIAGTGAGKSLTFLLPSCYPGYGQTIIIVPLAALRHDIVARCQKHSIRVSVWKDGHCDQSASVILATPECIGQSGFVEMTHRLSITGKLERIVVDEFHYVLLPDHTYRPHLLELRKLTQFGVRLTLLSATIPFQEQVDAFRLLGVPTDVVPFRVSTSRPNLSWQVATISLSSKENIGDLAEYVRSQLQLYCKILVYVDFAATVEALSAELQCGRYHGKMTLEERQESQAAFCTSVNGILVATSAFLVGIHVPNIRAVLWMGMPDHIISLVQGGGRGGRDGDPCLVRLVLSPHIADTHYRKAEPAHRAMVDAFVQQNTRHPICRRRVLDEYFDNDTERLACRTHEQPCDICGKRMQTHHASPSHETGTIAVLNSNKKTKTHVHALVSTPVRTILWDNNQNFATPVTSTSPSMSSQVNYELSVPRDHQSGRSTIGTIDITGSPSVPRRPQEADYRLPSWADSNVTTPCNRGPLKSKSSPAFEYVTHLNQPLGGDPTNTDSTSFDGSATRFTLARQNRQLEFNTDILGNANAARSDLFHHQLPATQTFWITHCVVCFCAHQDYQHAREQCQKFIGTLVRQYRQKMNNTWGRGMCWQCFMPANCCPKWSPSGVGRTMQQPDPQVTCVDRRAILDTWVYLWDQCLELKPRWVERIQTVQADFTPTNDIHFRRYFQQMVPFGDDYKASRLCLDVNWLTQSFIMHDNGTGQLPSPHHIAK